MISFHDKGSNHPLYVHYPCQTSEKACEVVYACSDMDFVEILERVPPLLEACIAGEDTALRRLRLVDKEFCRIALLALKIYTLTLKGSPTDTIVCGARFLRQTQLQDLHVYLGLSGMLDSHKPQFQTEVFCAEEIIS